MKLLTEQNIVLMHKGSVIKAAPINQSVFQVTACCKMVLRSKYKKSRAIISHVNPYSYVLLNAITAAM